MNRRKFLSLVAGAAVMPKKLVAAPLKTYSFKDLVFSSPVAWTAKAVSEVQTDIHAVVANWAWVVRHPSETDEEFRERYRQTPVHVLVKKEEATEWEQVC